MINDIVTIIQTCGFPIAMCIAIFWYMMQEQEKHAEESKDIREAINELKIAITTLTDKIGGSNE